jgi:hypothetical protein
MAIEDSPRLSIAARLAFLDTRVLAGGKDKDKEQEKSLSGFAL